MNHSDKKNLLFDCNNLRVTVEHTNKTIIENISFSLEKGKSICIMGESGSGKTTIVNHVADFSKEGLKVENPVRIDREKVTVFSVCQDADFFLDPYKTLYYYVKRAFLMRNRDNSKANAVKDPVDIPILMDYVCKIGLLKPLFEDNGKFTTGEIENIANNGKDREKKEFSKILVKTLKTRTKQKLSGGEKQKFFLLLGFIVNPDILVADEIFTDIDDASKKRISHLIFTRDFTVIFISHNIGMVKRLMDNHALSRVYYLKEKTFDSEIWENSNHDSIPGWANQMIRAYNNLRKAIKKNAPIEKETSADIYRIIKARKVFHDGRMVKFDCRSGSIRLHKGINYAFVGENGAGKTTLFKILAKLYEFDGDILYFHDNDFAKLSKVSRLDFVYKNQLVFQKTGNAVDDNKSVREYLLSFFKRQERKQALGLIHDLFKEFFNADKAENILNHRFHDLSVGEQRRVLLIQALMLVSNNGVLLIDEAMRGMDIFLKETLANYIKEKNQQVFLITHDSNLVRAICHQYVMFEYERTSGTTYLSGPWDMRELKI